MRLCLNCGIRGTSAPHGFCSGKEHGCIWKAHYQLRMTKAAHAAMDAYVEELSDAAWAAASACSFTGGIKQFPRKYASLRRRRLTTMSKSF
jgi:hypothetical protein